MRKSLTVIGFVAVALAGAGWWITMPERVDPADYAGLIGVPGRGAVVFHAGGCASCHSSEGASA